LLFNYFSRQVEDIIREKNENNFQSNEAAFFDKSDDFDEFLFEIDQTGTVSSGGSGGGGVSSPWSLSSAGSGGAVQVSVSAPVAAALAALSAPSVSSIRSIFAAHISPAGTGTGASTSTSRSAEASGLFSASGTAESLRNITVVGLALLEL
jgi:hypothetical protein